MYTYDKICQLCGENTVNTETGTCNTCKHIQAPVKDTDVRIARERHADLLVDLAEHIWVELVDNSEQVYVTHTLEDDELTINVTAPAREIARIMGKKKIHFKHTKALLYAVAQKYKFYLRFNYSNL